MCDVLKEIYMEVYTEPFSYDSLDKRIKLQKAVYLLENMGVHVGDYSFSWDKYGPYSLALDIDAKNYSLATEQNVQFSELAIEKFFKLRDIINKRINYNCVEWMECIAALHYLKNIYRITEQKLLIELKNRKPYLDNDIANKKALSILSDIKVGN